MPRRWIWLQVLIGWLPIGALFATLVLTAHPGATVLGATLISLRMMLAGAALGVLVQRLTNRLPWPHPMRASFVAIHLVSAVVFAVLWLAANSIVESVMQAQAVIVVGPGIGPFLVMGVWLYVMVAGVSYAAYATERAAHAEAIAAQSRLAALRSQLNPHFLFNALHTVVQLIPREPRRAAEAAEQLAGILRTTIEEDRDLVSLGDELAFVERYLDIERIRFGDRLRVQVDVADDARGVLVPSYAVQTLVENAVRHGAAPRVEPTDVTIAATVSGGVLTLTVSDTGGGATVEQIDASQGTGLRRLRRRLDVLYGTRAGIGFGDGTRPGFAVTLRVPCEAAD